jgi:hypothetical protein
MNLPQSRIFDARARLSVSDLSFVTPVVRIFQADRSSAVAHSARNDDGGKNTFDISSMPSHFSLFGKHPCRVNE